MVTVGSTARGCLVLLQASASRSRYALGVRLILVHRAPTRHRTSRAPASQVRTAVSLPLQPAECQRPGFRRPQAGTSFSVCGLLFLEENLAQRASWVRAIDAESRHELGRLLETPGFGILGAFRKSKCSRPAYGHQHRCGRGSAEQEAPPGLQPLGLRRISSRRRQNRPPPGGDPTLVVHQSSRRFFGDSPIVPHHIGPPRAKQPRLHRPDRGDHSADPAGRTVGLSGIRNAPLADPARSTTIDRTGPWGAGQWARTWGCS